VTEGVCSLCRQRKRTHSIRNGFLICPRCVAITAKNARDGLAHRPTFSYVENSLRQLAESVMTAIGGLCQRMEIIERRQALLEARCDLTPVTNRKSDIIRDLLVAEPALSVRELQQRTGIKADTIRKVMKRTKSCVV